MSLLLHISLAFGNSDEVNIYTGEVESIPEPLGASISLQLVPLGFIFLGQWTGYGFDLEKDVTERGKVFIDTTFIVGLFANQDDYEKTNSMETKARDLRFFESSLGYRQYGDSIYWEALGQYQKTLIRYFEAGNGRGDRLTAFLISGGGGYSLKTEGNLLIRAGIRAGVAAWKNQESNLESEEETRETLPPMAKTLESNLVSTIQPQLEFSFGYIF